MKTVTLVLLLVLGLSAAAPASAQEPAAPQAPSGTYCVQVTTIGGITTPRVCLPI